MYLRNWRNTLLQNQIPILPRLACNYHRKSFLLDSLVESETLDFEDLACIAGCQGSFEGSLYFGVGRVTWYDFGLSVNENCDSRGRPMA